MVHSDKKKEEVANGSYDDDGHPRRTGQDFFLGPTTCSFNILFGSFNFVDSLIWYFNLDPNKNSWLRPHLQPTKFSASVGKEMGDSKAKGQTPLA